tara:strand:- start:86211 stop:86969 length:759 start_codon:yes stop_codon:yes gene_type:complete
MGIISSHTEIDYRANGAVAFRIPIEETELPGSDRVHSKTQELFDGSGVPLNVSEVAFARRESVFLEDDAADCFYEITSGMVCVFMAMADGRRQIVRFASKGDIVGLTLLERYEMSAETVTRTTALRVRPSGLREKLATVPQLAKNLLTYANAELVEAHQQMLMIGRKTATERVATFLWMMAEKCQRHGWREGHIPLAMSRADIADFLGLTTETVSRAITHLREAGLIACVGAGRVMLKDADSLQELALGEAA